MKKISFNSLSHFYSDVKNVINSPEFIKHEQMDRPMWAGLSYSDLQKFKYSYPFGVEKLKQLASANIQAPVKIKFWDSLDGFDIDIEKMYSGADFLLNERKVKNLPKQIDLYVNISEPFQISYENMLNKSYAVLKIVDQLESEGCRVAVYSISNLHLKNRNKDKISIEICIKEQNQTLNLGSLCTAISPWFLRYWVILWIYGRHKVNKGVAQPLKLENCKGIAIDTGQCLTISGANKFINNIKI